MFGWFRRYVRKVGILGVEVEFHPPTGTTAGAPAPATPAVAQSNQPATPLAVTQHLRQKVDWQQLLAILQQRVGAGQVTTYGECSQWAFGHRGGGQSIRAMLEAAARRGNQLWTNRVVFDDGSCGAADGAYGQSAQLQAEGVPFVGQTVNLAQCPPVVL